VVLGIKVGNILLLEYMFFNPPSSPFLPKVETTQKFLFSRSISGQVLKKKGDID
jgi:hypothetical protein